MSVGPLAARILWTPFVYPDGQIDVQQEIVREPQGVELDGGWVHVVEHDAFGGHKRLRSYPATEIQRVEWTEPEVEEGRP